MRQEKLKQDWDQVRSKVREKWQRLTEGDVQQIDGESERLVGRIEQRYGVDRDWAKWQVQAWNPRFDISEIKSRAPTYLAND